VIDRFPTMLQVDMSKLTDTFSLGDRDKILEQVTNSTYCYG
jgi:hypothetical protein